MVRWGDHAEELIPSVLLFSTQNVFAQWSRHLVKLRYKKHWLQVETLHSVDTDYVTVKG
jgi:hypothetical protein